MTSRRTKLKTISTNGADIGSSAAGAYVVLPLASWPVSYTSLPPASFMTPSPRVPPNTSLFL
jgi:hypothetical protein